MGRQRTIRDQAFWRSPRLLNCSTEDKVALLHLLTAPDSNITGVYPLVPRIAGAEIGWTAEQWLQVMHRLQDEGLANYDLVKYVVWVRIWWDHHSATQVTGPKLRARAVEEIRRIPSDWLDDFLRDFNNRLDDGQQRLISDALLPRSNPAVEDVSVPKACGIDTVSDQGQHNSKPQPQPQPQPQPSPETKTTNLSSSEVDMSGIPTEHRTDVHRGIVKARTTGKLRNGVQIVVNAMAEKYRSESGKPQNAMALTMYLAEHLNAPDAP